MARSRNIKPGFFSNDILAECDIFARFLFAGLWTIADRAGRLEDRPKKIKAEILPYDNCDANDLLNQLEKYKFIVRYEVNNIKYIQIVNFDKHQNPHKNEAESIIPAPESINTSTVQAPELHSTNPASSLIPDSLPLIPDSLSNKQTNAGAPARGSKDSTIELENLTTQNITDWLMQQEVSGSPIIVDVRAELEKFKVHYLSYDGKDKNGNAVKNWVAKFGSWLLNANKQAKYGGNQDEKILGNNRSGAVQTTGGNPAGSKRERSEQATAAIIAKRNAEWEARQQETDVTPTNRELLGFSEPT